MELTRGYQLAILLVAILAPVSRAIALQEIADQDGDSLECPENYCEFGGRCIVKSPENYLCECSTFPLVLPVNGENKTMNFYGDRCQENFYTCAVSNVKTNCMMDAEKLQEYHDLIYNAKYKQVCDIILEKLIPCIDRALHECADGKPYEDLMEPFKANLSLVEQQMRYCQTYKYGRFGKPEQRKTRRGRFPINEVFAGGVIPGGDNCCGRICNFFDEDRLCQCNKACGRFGDCCETTIDICPTKYSHPRHELFTALNKGYTKRGKRVRKEQTYCEANAQPLVKTKAKEMLDNLYGIWNDLHITEEKINEKVEKIEEIKRLKKEQFVFRDTPEHSIEVEPDEVEALQVAFKLAEKAFLELRNQEQGDDMCGNCSRRGCPDPCMHKCKCEEYPNAVCRMDTCVLAPCDPSLPCVARWYVRNDAFKEDHEQGYDEVTMACHQTPINC